MSPHLLAGVVVVCALLAGCGGDDAHREAKAAFLKQADAICAKANADQKALTTPTAQSQLPPYVLKVVTIAETATTGLLGLDLPEQDAQQIKAKLLDPLKDQVVVGKDYAAKVAAADKAKDQAELLRLLGNPPTETKADLRWMKSYGFDDCIDAADTAS